MVLTTPPRTKFLVTNSHIKEYVRQPRLFKKCRATEGERKEEERRGGGGEEEKERRRRRRKNPLIVFRLRRPGSGQKLYYKFGSEAYESKRPVSF